MSDTEEMPSGYNDRRVITISGHRESYDEALIFFAKTTTDCHLVNVSFSMYPEFRDPTTLWYHVQITGYVMPQATPGSLDRDVVFDNPMQHGDSDE
jgi:hypothetical protein